MVQYHIIQERLGGKSETNGQRKAGKKKKKQASVSQTLMRCLEVKKALNVHIHSETTGAAQLAPLSSIFMLKMSES